MKNLYLIGGGGHCRACIDVIESTNEFVIKGIFDVKKNIGKKILGYEVIGTDDNIEKYKASENYFLITVGQIKSAKIRIKLFELGLQFATVISSRAHVSKHSQLGEGTIVMHDACIGPNTIIGKNNIINSKSLIEHDCKTGDHCHISTASVVNGDCVIGDEVFVGSNSVLRNNIIVADKTIISYGTRYE